VLRLTINAGTVTDKFLKQSFSIMIMGLFTTLLLTGVLLGVFYLNLVRSPKPHSEGLSGKMISMDPLFRLTSGICFTNPGTGSKTEEYA